MMISNVKRKRSRLDNSAETRVRARGLAPGADPSTVVRGVVVDLDTPGNRVKVAVNGGAGSWMAALPFRYIVGRTVFVQRNPFAGGASLMCLGPVFPAWWAGRATAVLSAIDTTNGIGTISIDGATYELPYVDGPAYTVSGGVWVLRSTTDGTPYLIAGLSVSPPPDPTPDTPTDLSTVPAPPAAPASTQTRTATIVPTWSGTYRYDQSAFDRWNVERYGGRSTLYQGGAHGSGTLKGLAVYGDQIVNLNAIEITALAVVLRGAELREATYPAITVQASAHGSKPSGAPSSTGTTSAGSPGKAGTDEVALDSSLFAGFADGTYRGLCTVGSGYAAVRGTSAADGMALKITYITAA